MNGKTWLFCFLMRLFLEKENTKSLISLGLRELKRTTIQTPVIAYMELMLI